MSCVSSPSGNARRSETATLEACTKLPGEKGVKVDADCKSPKSARFGERLTAVAYPPARADVCAQSGQSVEAYEAQEFAWAAGERAKLVAEQRGRHEGEVAAALASLRQRPWSAGAPSLRLAGDAAPSASETACNTEESRQLVRSSVERMRQMAVQAVEHRHAMERKARELGAWSGRTLQSKAARAFRRATRQRLGAAVAAAGRESDGAAAEAQRRPSLADVGPRYLQGAGLPPSALSSRAQRSVGVGSLSAQLRGEARRRGAAQRASDTACELHAMLVSVAEVVTGGAPDPVVIAILGCAKERLEEGAFVNARLFTALARSAAELTRLMRTRRGADDAAGAGESASPPPPSPSPSATVQKRWRRHSIGTGGAILSPRIQSPPAAAGRSASAGATKRWRRHSLVDIDAFRATTPTLPDDASEDGPAPGDEAYGWRDGGAAAGEVLLAAAEACGVSTGAALTFLGSLGHRPPALRARIATAERAAFLLEQREAEAEAAAAAARARRRMGLARSGGRSSTSPLGSYSRPGSPSGSLAHSGNSRPRSPSASQAAAQRAARMRRGSACF